MEQRQSPDFTSELTDLRAEGGGLMDDRFTGYTEQSHQRTVN